MKSKKAMEVSPTSVVVILILLLIVLSVLIFIFASSAGGFANFVNGLRGQLTDKGNVAQCEGILNPDQKCGACPSGYNSVSTLPPPGKNWDCSSCKKCVLK